MCVCVCVQGPFLGAHLKGWRDQLPLTLQVGAEPDPDTRFPFKFLPPIWDLIADENISEEEIRDLASRASPSTTAPKPLLQPLPLAVTPIKSPQRGPGLTEAGLHSASLRHWGGTAGSGGSGVDVGGWVGATVPAAHRPGSWVEEHSSAAGWSPEVEAPGRRDSALEDPMSALINAGPGEAASGRPAAGKRDSAQPFTCNNKDDPWDPVDPADPRADLVFRPAPWDQRLSAGPAATSARPAVTLAGGMAEGKAKAPVAPVAALAAAPVHADAQSYLTTMGAVPGKVTPAPSPPPTAVGGWHPMQPPEFRAATQAPRAQQAADMPAGQPPPPPRQGAYPTWGTNPPEAGVRLQDIQQDEMRMRERQQQHAANAPRDDMRKAMWAAQQPLPQQKLADIMDDEENAADLEGGRCALDALALPCISR
jgi:hypothetical protein